MSVIPHAHTPGDETLDNEITLLVAGRGIGRTAMSQSLSAALSSGSGSVSAAVIAASHAGSSLAMVLALVVFLTTQVPVLVICRLRWRLGRLQEKIALAAFQNPRNKALRTLMDDVARTNPYETHGSAH
jgi:hypothetical protein